MCNTDIRSEAKQAGVYLYAIAERLGISEPTMTRLLRHELPENKKKQLKDIIAELSVEKAKQEN